MLQGLEDFNIRRYPLTYFNENNDADHNDDYKYSSTTNGHTDSQKGPRLMDAWST